MSARFGYTRLLRAVVNDNVGEVADALFYMGADNVFDRPLERGMPAPILAAASCSPRVLKLLIETRPSYLEVVNKILAPELAITYCEKFVDEDVQSIVQRVESVLKLIYPDKWEKECGLSASPRNKFGFRDLLLPLANARKMKTIETVLSLLRLNAVNRDKLDKRLRKSVDETISRVVCICLMENGLRDFSQLDSFIYDKKIVETKCQAMPPLFQAAHHGTNEEFQQVLYSTPTWMEDVYRFEMKDLIQPFNIFDYLGRLGDFEKVAIVYNELRKKQKDIDVKKKMDKICDNACKAGQRDLISRMIDAQYLKMYYQLWIKRLDLVLKCHRDMAPYLLDIICNLGGSGRRESVVRMKKRIALMLLPVVNGSSSEIFLRSWFSGSGLSIKTEWFIDPELVRKVLTVMKTFQVECGLSLADMGFITLYRSVIRKGYVKSVTVFKEFGVQKYLIEDSTRNRKLSSCMQSQHLETAWRISMVVWQKIRNSHAIHDLCKARHEHPYQSAADAREYMAKFQHLMLNKKIANKVSFRYLKRELNRWVSYSSGELHFQHLQMTDFINPFHFSKIFAYGRDGPHLLALREICQSLSWLCGVTETVLWHGMIRTIMRMDKPCRLAFCRVARESGLTVVDPELDGMVGVLPEGIGESMYVPRWEKCSLKNLCRLNIRRRIVQIQGPERKQSLRQDILTLDDHLPRPLVQFLLEGDNQFVPDYFVTPSGYRRRGHNYPAFSSSEESDSSDGGEWVESGESDEDSRDEEEDDDEDMDAEDMDEDEEDDDVSIGSLAYLVQEEILEVDDDDEDFNLQEELEESEVDGDSTGEELENNHGNGREIDYDDIPLEDEEDL